MREGWIFWGGMLVQCAALLALMIPRCHQFMRSRAFLLKWLLVSGAGLLGLYAWLNADFVLCLGQILLAVVLWSAIPSHVSTTNSTDETSHAS